MGNRELAPVMKILPKYIMRELLVTLSFAVGVFTFVLLLARLLKQISELLVNRHAGLAMVGQFILLMLPSVLAFALPMALLAAVLLVFGRLSADSEITAMRASGVSLGRVAAPVLVVAVALGGVCFYLNAQLMPQCRFASRTLFVRLTTENPMALLEEGTYIKDFPGYVVYVGRKTKTTIEEVILYTLDDEGRVVSSLRAQTGTVIGDPVNRKLLLDLRNVRGDLRDPDDPTNVRKIRPGTTALRYPVELDVSRAFRQAAAARQLPDLTWRELLTEIARLRGMGVYPAAALLDAHQRAAGAVACVAFALIGIPLGIKTSRRETTIGMAVAIGLASAYYVMLVVAHTLKSKPYLYPEAVLWMPNLVFQGLGLWLLWRVSRK
jgi:lipopolysaccharide export system permease protein